MQLPQGVFAIVAMHGNNGQVEYVTVAVQDGGLKHGGKLLDQKVFWSRDYETGDELIQAALDWALGKGAKVFCDNKALYEPQDCECCGEPTIVTAD
jgi:hypothetical protein